MRPVAPLAAIWAVLLMIQGCGRLGFDARPLWRDAGAVQTDSGMDSGAPPPPAMDAGDDGAVLDADGGMVASEPAADGGDAGEEDSGAADAGCATSPITDYCAELPALMNEPTIDGTLDCGPTLTQLTPNGWTGGDGTMPALARFAMGWWPEGIYVYVEVDDDRILDADPITTPWCGDGVEVYVDSDAEYSAETFYDAMGTIQLIARAPAGNQPDLTGDRWRNAMPKPVRVGDWNTDYVMVTRPGGYAFEAKVTARDLDIASALLLQAGNKVGIDVGVNVSVAESGMMGLEADCPGRLGQYFLKIKDGGCTSMGCLPFMNTLAFCDSELKPP